MHQTSPAAAAAYVNASPGIFSRKWAATEQAWFLYAIFCRIYWLRRRRKWSL